MKKLRVYIDTSVIGGCLDPEFKKWSDRLMEDFKNHCYYPVLSDVTAAEIAMAPANVKLIHQELLSLPAEVISVNEEAILCLSTVMPPIVFWGRVSITTCFI